MGKLYCILGKSGVGKDTLFKQIMKTTDLNIQPIIPYTTRPKRSNEQEGVQYHFVNDQELAELEKQNKVIEKRQYDTVFGVWSYFTVDTGLDFKNNYLFITTLEAIEKLANWYGPENIVIIYLEISDRVRLERAINRENTQESPNYSEVCRRYLADEIDFSEDKLSVYANLYRINAEQSLEQCVRSFVNIMSQVENRK
ncbi:guanylate kinase [Paludicola sp. MB14-C6]|uniref:guanylate kinase n=1 Tax=Paludihabitans sp. MB14-C6 TaxID=3070656 RepID=UPI0027DDA972|nr:guanylate kinase [Paludicola sp. MB14-C6]WMJ21927.1 guanylate kinase [Paludicola sp. MB14-C6]